MCNIFIANSLLKDISQELIKSIQNNDKQTIESVYLSNAYNNSKTSYILKNGKPISFVKKVVR